MPADANVALTTFTSSAIAVGAINWLKHSKYFPWITREKIWLLRIMSIAAATATSVGITHVWNSTDHSILIGGLTLTNLWAFLWSIIKSFTAQETIFQATKPSSNPAVVEAVAPEAAVPEKH